MFINGISIFVKTNHRIRSHNGIAIEMIPIDKDVDKLLSSCPAIKWD